MHVDLVVTPEGVIHCPRPERHRLPRLDLAELTDEKITAIPALARISAATGRR